MKQLFLASIVLVASTSAKAIDASDFDDLVGYTIVAVTQVNDEFEGCDHDKRIRFDNGWTLTCSEYSYSYAYRPDAVIFAKSFPYRGTTYWMLKALIDDEFYDMEPVRAK
jgi:hypothetical protein